MLVFFGLMCSQARIGAWLDLGVCGSIVFEGPGDVCFAPGSKCWCLASININGQSDRVSLTMDVTIDTDGFGVH